MTLTDNDIERLSKKGLRLTDSNGELITIKRNDNFAPPLITVLKKEPKSEIDYLRAIAELLGRLLHKPVPKPQKIEPPQITVEPPAVVVNPAPPQELAKPITKWKFVLTKNSMGQTKEIVATAIE